MIVPVYVGFGYVVHARDHSLKHDTLPLCGAGAASSTRRRSHVTVLGTQTKITCQRCLAVMERLAKQDEAQT